MPKNHTVHVYIGFLVFFVTLLGGEAFLGYTLKIMTIETPSFKLLYLFTIGFTLYNCYIITKAIITCRQEDATDKPQEERESPKPHEEL